MNDNTVLRIKVPAHLYESVKEQLTLKEAPKEVSHELLQKIVDDLLAKYGNTEQMKSDILVALRAKINDMLNNMHPQLKTKFREEETVNEAKSTKAFNDWKVVKEKKLPKDGMKKVEETVDNIEEKKEDMKKQHSLDELKAAKAKLDKKIEEMESTKEEGKVEESVFADPNFWAGVGGLVLGAVPFIKMKYDQWKSAKTPEEKDKLEKELASAIQKKMSGGM